ncbi:MAG: hypothetical protein Q8N36_04565 [bacterium]|nr:hypothetical protein [bacterium]
MPNNYAQATSPPAAGRRPETSGEGQAMSQATSNMPACGRQAT